ncbi:hypothetical protein [uncultured Shimia sp.]|nr:hypothetical protein [uncultured Shimia sp.]
MDEVFTGHHAPEPGTYFYFPREYRTLTPFRVCPQLLKEGN